VATPRDSPIKAGMIGRYIRIQCVAISSFRYTMMPILRPPCGPITLMVVLSFVSHGTWKQHMSITRAEVAWGRPKIEDGAGLFVGYRAIRTLRSSESMQRMKTF
jgi:hypothetical protein